MSRIVLGVGASHSTLMNTHWHEVETLDRALAFRAGLDRARAMVAGAKPDTVVIVGSNHFRGFWLDLLPAFTIGVGTCHMSGESGTPEGPIGTDVALGQHLLHALFAADFDPAFSTKMQVDHGITHAVQFLLTGLDVPIVPIIINVFAPPLPSLARAEHFGRVLGEAIAGDGDGKRVVVIASGGLSHRLPFPDWAAPETDDDRFLVHAWTDGRANWKDFDPRRREIIRAAAPAVNMQFDEEVLGLLADGRLEALTSWSPERLVAAGGNGANELRTWLVMAAACGHRGAETIVYSPMPEWLTGMAVSVSKESE